MRHLQTLVPEIRPHGKAQICAMRPGAGWTYRSPMHMPATHTRIGRGERARVLWLGNPCPHSKKLGRTKDQVFPEIAVTADARQVGGHHYAGKAVQPWDNARMDDARAV